jgi:adenosylhomocysteine nucleosidase
MLTLVIALECEAKPVIREYRLSRRSDCREFPVFENDRRRVVISGIGKLAACAATAYAAMLPTTEREVTPPAFLNYGLAGHGGETIGTAWYASSVRDCGSGRRWFPSQLFDPDCPRGPVTTFDRPNDDYEIPGAFDMELAGVVACAQRFTSLEFIQALKVVADDEIEVRNKLSATAGAGLCKDQLPTLATLVRQIEQLQAELAHPQLTLAGNTLDHLSLSAYQRSECRKLIQQLGACGSGSAEIEALCHSAGSGRELVRTLRRALRDTDLVLEL